MEEEKPHSCPVCGGFEFMKENGYFYCLECQTQCEDFCEQVFENEGRGGMDEEKLIGTPFVRKVKKRTKLLRKGDDFTSWEMLNFVLRGLVEELILAGAPSTLRDTVLQLWAYYLKKIEAAFVSKEEQLLPKLGLRFRVADAKLLFGLKDKKRVKTNRMTSEVADLNTTIHTLTDWSSMQIKKKLRNKAKKAFMEKIAEKSIEDLERSNLDQSSVFSASEFDDSISVISTSTQPDSSTSPANWERTEAAKNWISEQGLDATELRNFRDYLDPTIPSRKKLLGLLHLALLYEGSNIQLSDMIRWIREGHISFIEAAKHLPESCFVQGRYCFTFNLEHKFPSSGSVNTHASILAKYLEFVEWTAPNVEHLAKKYVEELQLPELFIDLIVRFVARFPMSFKMRPNNEIPNYEGRILAVLIIILKLLLGLDGKTELHISKAASQLNKWMKKKNGHSTPIKLFVWKDWVEQLICRDAVLVQYHFPTKHLLCPDAYGNPKTYIDFCNTSHDNNAGLYEKFNYVDPRSIQVDQPALLNTFTSILEKLKDPAPCENQNIKFPQCFTPFSLYIKNIIEKSAELDEPLISKNALRILTKDFSKCDVTYLLSPQSVASLEAACGHTVKIKNTSAQKKFSKIHLTKDRGLDSTCNCFVAVVHCTRRRTKAPENSDNEDYSLARKNIKKDLLKRAVQKIKRRKLKEMKSARKLKKKSKKGCDAKHNALKVSAKSRKRKKHDPSTGSAKKMRMSKILKLYVPCSKYWIHSDSQAMTDDVFSTQIFHRFPSSFSWLLGECALMAEMSKLSLYREVLRIEKLLTKTKK